MLRKCVTLWLTCSLLTAALAKSAYGQHYQPFIDPGYFNPDFQYFAPVDDWEPYGQRQHNTGFFATYDRVHLWVSRPEQEPSFTEGDWTWGNRYDLGYMTDEDHGWQFTILRVDGPNANIFLRRERLNRFNPDDFAADGRFLRPDDPEDMVFPVVDRNTQFFDNEIKLDFLMGREYLLQDSLNVGKLNSFELNKTYRLAPYKHGGVMEPYLGFRYVRFEDFTIRDSYIGPFNANFGTPFAPIPVFAEQLTNEFTRVENDMYGGQLGLRYFHVLNRWNLSNQVSFFGMQNFQNLHSRTRFTVTGYEDINIGQEVVGERVTEFHEWDHNAQFVLGINVRAQAAYQVTRDLRLRVGMEYLHFGRGIWRGTSLAFADQDLILAGVTMGLEINR